MQILRFADLRPMPWKNGRGTTVEYAVCPDGAGLDDFSWRISRATVAGHGPFSVFPGIDRTLAVVTGAGIDLAFPEKLVRLDRVTPPYDFPADATVEGRLISGPIEDLNVMSRRGLWRHSLVRRSLDAPATIAIDADVGFVVALGSLALVVENDAPERLDDGDAAILDGPATVRLAPLDAPATALVVELHYAAN